MTQTTSFLMVFHQGDYCQIIHGKDAVDAVRGHYDEMDAMCPPQDPEYKDEFTVTVYEIAEPSEEVIEALSVRMEEGDYSGCDELHADLQPGRRSFEVHVSSTFRDGAVATPA